MGANMYRIFIFSALITFAWTLPLRESSNDLIEERATGNIKFYLYTSKNPSIPQQLFIDDEASVKNSNFNSGYHTKILIHGWGGSYTTSPNNALRLAYLSKGNYNIISIDWYAYAKLNYISSRAKVPAAGEEVAEFLDFLNEKFNLSFDHLVVIGHSLGAHVAGFTGKFVKNGKVAGIVGLDPAFPLYSFDNPSTRLANTDASYVQSIQTNGNANGFLKPIGSASFYPNWGRSQPGCGLDLNGGCAHARSVTYYAEAVRGYSFAPVYACENYENVSEKGGCISFRDRAELGDPLEIRQVEGIFYLTTNAESPFGHLVERNMK